MGEKFHKIIILTAISFSLSCLLYFSGAHEIFELKAYDLFSIYLNPKAPDDTIVIVEVDQQSIDALSKEGVNWPWPRQIYAPIIDYLSEADAVFIDIIFSEPSSYGREDDLIMAEAIKKSANIYLPTFLSMEEKAISPATMEFMERSAVNGDYGSGLTSFRSAITPIDIFKDVTAGTGNVMIKPDMDGVYRKMPLASEIHGLLFPSFVPAYLDHGERLLFKEGELYLDNEHIADHKGNILLRYFANPRPFQREPAIKIIKSYLSAESGAVPEIPKEHFKGKKVFIGLTAAGLYDLRPTAVSSISTGVLIHATALENLMHKNYIRPLPASLTPFLLFIICFIVNLVVLRNPSIILNISFFIVAILSLAALLAMLFKSGYYTFITPPLASIPFSFVIAAAYSYATEGKERRFVRRAFSQYMDVKVVNYILKNPDIIKPGGKRKRLTLFFTDIAGFTTMAEKMPAEQTAKLLNLILNSLSEIIISNKGVIDKYIGDAIMAFWGAPVESGEDENRACRTATQCLDAMKKINTSFKKEGVEEVSIRIGIHSGDAIVGNLGSDRLFDFTAIGDTVNLASRLEGVNKFFKTGILVSEETKSKTGDKFLMRDLGLIEVKGKNRAIRVYELLSETNNATRLEKEKVFLFSQGMRLFKEKNWDAAIERFNEVLKVYPDDGPSQLYIERCSSFKVEPPPGDSWDVFKLTVK
jgi:adenylate cyclase